MPPARRHRSVCLGDPTIRPRATCGRFGTVSLDTPERFLDWLECYHRERAETLDPGELDHLVECRRAIEPRATQRLRRSHN